MSRKKRLPLNSLQLLFGARLESQGDALGTMVNFSGFRRDELEAPVSAWRLALCEAAADGHYLIERIPWSLSARDLWLNTELPTHGLSSSRISDEDALVGQAGVLWLAPGRRLARMAIREKGYRTESLDELFGAALAHVLALDSRLPLHAMAASIDDVGVMALGRSMAGKSTLGVAMLHVGAKLVSDDFLLVRRLPEGAEVTAMRRDLRLRESTWGLVPAGLQTHLLSNSASSDHRILRRSDASEQFVPRATPRVLWFLDGVRSDSLVQTSAMSQAEALALMIEATSPLFVSARYEEERGRLLAVMTSVVESTLSYRVRLGSRLLQAPADAVRELLARTIPSAKLDERPVSHYSVD